MAGIHVEARYVAQVEKAYNRWRHARAGTVFTDVTGGPFADGSVDRYFSDEFVDELEGSGFPFKRLVSR